MNKKSIDYLINKSQEVTDAMVSNASKKVVGFKNILKNTDELEVSDNTIILKETILKIKETIDSNQEINDLIQLKDSLINLWEPVTKELQEILISREDLIETTVWLDEILTDTKQKLKAEAEKVAEQTIKIEKLTAENLTLENQLTNSWKESKTTLSVPDYEHHYVTINRLVGELVKEDEENKKFPLLELIAELEDKKEELEADLAAKSLQLEEKLKEQKSVVSPSKTVSSSDKGSKPAKTVPGYMKSTAASGSRKVIKDKEIKGKDVDKSKKKTAKQLEEQARLEKEKLQALEIAKKEQEIVELKKAISIHSEKIGKLEKLKGESEEDKKEKWNEENRIELEVKIKELELIIEEFKSKEEKKIKKATFHLEDELEAKSRALARITEVKDKEMKSLKVKIEMLEKTLEYEEFQMEDIPIIYELLEKQEELEDENRKFRLNRCRIAEHQNHLELTIDNSRLVNENKTLKSDNDSLRSQIKEVENQWIEKLQIKEVQSEQDSDYLNGRIDEESAISSNLREEIENLVIQNEKERDLHDKTKQILEEREKELQQKDLMIAELSELTGKPQIVDKILTETRKETYTPSLPSIEKEFLKEEKQELTAELAQVKEELRTARKEIQEAQTKTKEQVKQARDTNPNIIAKQWDDAQVEIGTLTSELDAAQNQVKTLTTERNDACADLANRTAKVEVLTKERDQARTERDARAKISPDDLTTLQANLREEKGRGEEQKKQIQLTVVEKSDLETQITELQATINNLTNELKQLENVSQSYYQVSEAEKTQLRQQVIDEMETAESELNNLKNNNQDLEQAREKLLSAYYQKEKEAEEKNNQLSYKHKINSYLVSEKDTLQDRNNILQSELNQTQSELNDLIQERNEVSEHLDLAHKRIEELETKIRGLEPLSDLEVQLNWLKRDYSSEFEELTSEGKEFNIKNLVELLKRKLSQEVHSRWKNKYRKQRKEERKQSQTERTKFINKLKGKQQTIWENEDYLINSDEVLATKNTQITTLNKQIDQQTQIINQLSSQIKGLNEVIEDKNEDIADLETLEEEKQNKAVNLIQTNQDLVKKFHCQTSKWEKKYKQMIQERDTYLTERDNLQDWKNNHSCLSPSVHTCPPCSLPHLPAPHTCPIVNVNCSHNDYDQLKNELNNYKSQLGNHICQPCNLDHNICSEKYHEELVKNKENKIFNKIITELQLSTSQEKENVLEAVITEIKSKINPPNNKSEKDQKINELEVKINYLQSDILQQKPQQSFVDKVIELSKKLNIMNEKELLELKNSATYLELTKKQNQKIKDGLWIRKDNLKIETRKRRVAEKINYVFGGMILVSLLILLLATLKRRKNSIR